MKGIIIYQSKYGATAQYAEWLGEELGLPFINIKNITPEMVACIDLIIVGSPLYIGKVLITAWLKENAAMLTEKDVLLYIVCGTTADDLRLQQQVINNNFGWPLNKFAGMYFLPGRCFPSGLSWKDRFLLKMGAWMEKDPQKKRLMKEGFDKMERINMDEIVNKARELMNRGKYEETVVC